MIWRRDESKGDVYYYAPDGIKLRSRPDVASYIKSKVPKSSLNVMG